MSLMTWGGKKKAIFCYLLYLLVSPEAVLTFLICDDHSSAHRQFTSYYGS